MGNRAKTILLSAGGTGGHMTPAQALAKDLLSRGYKVDLATDERGIKYENMFEGVQTHIVKSGTMGAGLIRKVKGLMCFVFGCVQSFIVLMRIKPALVVGFGGYPSVPAVFVAQCLKIKTIIHEQNAIIGKANAFLAPKSERIAISLPYITGLDEVDKVRSIVTGNPVRAEIAALYNDPYPNLGEDGTLRILVMGGSLGATILSEIVPQTCSCLSAEYRRRLHIVQQCRAEDIDNVRHIYKQSNIMAELSTFFTDIPEELSKAHLVICRSGASTVSEIAASGRPAIFVPYPHHKDQQQKLNADVVSDSGGAWVMSEEGFTKEALLAKIENFLQNPSVLFRAAENSRKCGKPDAARKLGNLVTAIASGWDQ